MRSGPKIRPMTILTKREVWKKPRAANQTRRSSDLTPQEQANVKAALRFLRSRLGGIGNLAAAMKASRKTVSHACCRNGRPGAGLAIRVARTAEVSVEDVLGGVWPKAGACPHCGRA
jgi:hypothetical protein